MSVGNHGFLSENRSREDKISMDIPGSARVKHARQLEPRGLTVFKRLSFLGLGPAGTAFATHTVSTRLLVCGTWCLGGPALCFLLMTPPSPFWCECPIWRSSCMLLNSSLVPGGSPGGSLYGSSSGPVDNGEGVLVLPSEVVVGFGRAESPFDLLEDELVDRANLGSCDGGPGRDWDGGGAIEL